MQAKHFLLILFFLGIIFNPAKTQSFSSYTIGNNQDTLTNPSSGLCLMGGATEHDEAMRWFLQAADGGDILVLRTSGGDGYNNYMYSQLGVGLNSVTTIVCHDPSCVNELFLQQKIQQAEAIWFAGGDQWDYISYWRNTIIDSLINEGIQTRNIVIGGTSAGMAIQGGYYFSAANGTINSSTALSNPYDVNLTVDTAAFIQNHYMQNVITDTHFDNPDRKGRLAVFMARLYLMNWPNNVYAIACDEYTAVCIDAMGEARIFGDAPNYDDYAYFLAVRCVGEFPEMLQPLTALNWSQDSTAIVAHRFNGDQAGSKRFNVASWQPIQGAESFYWAVEQGNLIETQDSAASIYCLTGTENLETIALNYYPNPAKDYLFLEHQQAELLNYRLYNLNGALLKRWESAQIIEKIDIQNLPNGLYFLELQSKSQQITLKFAKTN
jgi:cyanophycinase-like exopeptidase